MRPAFDSTGQAALFGLLLLFLLAAPWLSAEKILPQPKQTYSSESIRFEQAPWMYKFIYEETNDIDIAFVGSSKMLLDIDTPYVQQKLDEQTGRQTVVRSICWEGNGFDGLYYFTRDLLAHRRVKTLVFNDECLSAVRHSEDAQMYATHWFRFADDFGMAASLPWKVKAIYYFAAVLGMPRNLSELLVSNLPYTPAGQASVAAVQHWYSVNPADRLGSMSAHLVRDLQLRASERGVDTNFTAYVPPTTTSPADVLVYREEAKTNFEFNDRPRPLFQDYFARQFGLLAKSHGCNLALLPMPVYGEKAGGVIPESRDWSDFLKMHVSLLGIPSGRLFNGLTEREISLLYSDNFHLNANGQKYFTTLITPAIINIYASHATY